MPQQPETSKLVSVDDKIDVIAREALAEARRLEEAERYRNNSGADRSVAENGDCAKISKP